MSRLLFVHNGQEKFVRDDQRLLSETHTLSDWYQSGRTFNPIRLLSAVAANDAVFCWFASWHSLFPALIARALHKPLIIVTGGYDTANVPEAGYGSQRGGLPKWIARVVIRLATHLIVNSQSARAETIANAHADPRKITVIYHGIEPLNLASELSVPRERLALNVGGVRAENLLRKGLLPFVQAAALLPNVQFVQAGQWFDSSIDTLKSAATPNMRFVGHISSDELNRLYARASVYVQPSLHEGFGLSVAEAMSAGCIPVVTRVGSLPEVVGSCGIFIAAPNTPDAIADGIRQALASPFALREQARAHILHSFPMERRRAALVSLISAALRSSGA